MILTLITVFVLVLAHSHKSSAAYQLRLAQSDLTDPNIVNARFKELVTRVFPLLFLGALPIAIIGDFMPPYIRGVLNAKKNSKFKGCPLHALVRRLHFFNLVLSSANLVDFKQWLNKLAAIHAAKGVSFSDALLAKFHHGVLGGVLTAVETLAPYLAWRRLSDREYTLIHAWLANVAKNLGLKTFPATLDALRAELAAYEEKHYQKNSPASAQAAKELFVKMTSGITRLVPVVGPVLRPVVEVLLTAAMSSAYRTGFGLKLSLVAKIVLIPVLLPVRAVLVLLGYTLPYLAIPVNFGHIVRFADSRAEERLTAY